MASHLWRRALWSDIFNKTRSKISKCFIFDIKLPKMFIVLVETISMTLLHKIWKVSMNFRIFHIMLTLHGFYLCNINLSCILLVPIYGLWHIFVMWNKIKLKNNRGITAIYTSLKKTKAPRQCATNRDIIQAMDK